MHKSLITRKLNTAITIINTTNQPDWIAFEWAEYFGRAWELSAGIQPDKIIFPYIYPCIVWYFKSIGYDISFSFNFCINLFYVAILLMVVWIVYISLVLCHAKLFPPSPNCCFSVKKKKTDTGIWLSIYCDQPLASPFLC